MSAIWLIKLLLAHLLSDFILQPSSWVAARTKKHFAAPTLYLHGLITWIIAWLMLGLQNWPIPIIIGITHILIDGWKSYRPQNARYFLLDQALHLAVIITCWLTLFYSPDEIKLKLLELSHNQPFLLVSTAIVFLTLPAGIMIGQLTRKWSDQLRGAEGLVNAGKWIGILERLLILLFLLQDQYGAIGLLITAKGLLRFSEKDRQEEKTEYVLIGSLTSVTVAVITGVVVKHFIP